MLVPRIYIGEEFLFLPTKQSEQPVDNPNNHRFLDLCTDNHSSSSSSSNVNGNASLDFEYPSLLSISISNFTKVDANFDIQGTTLTVVSSTETVVPVEQPGLRIRLRLCNSNEIFNILHCDNADEEVPCIAVSLVTHFPHEKPTNRASRAQSTKSLSTIINPSFDDNKEPKIELTNLLAANLPAVVPTCKTEQHTNESKSESTEPSLNWTPCIVSLSSNGFCAQNDASLPSVDSEISKANGTVDSKTDGVTRRTGISISDSQTYDSGITVDKEENAGTMQLQGIAESPSDRIGSSLFVSPSVNETTLPDWTTLSSPFTDVWCIAFQKAVIVCIFSLLWLELVAAGIV